MTKKSLLGYFGLFILSVIVTYTVAIIDAVSRNSLLAGSAGLPFRFASGSVFGSPSTDYGFLLVNIVFWFVIIWIIWKLIKKLAKRI